MVNFYLYGCNGTRIEKIDASDELPDEVVKMYVEGPFDSTKISYKCLTTMLKSSPKKLEKIEMYELADESPEFLSFLVLLCRKTTSLDITECPLSTNATSCLMASLLYGIRCLSFVMHESTMPTNQAKILLEGIASSPCLEVLDFRASDVEDHQVMGKYVIQALRRNQSLKEIRLQTSDFSRDDSTFMQKIVKTLILRPNVKAVSLIDFDRDLRLDVLQDVLCRKDCTLETLYLEGIRFVYDSVDLWLEGLIIQNVSVKSLTVNDTCSSSRTLANVINLFKSLEELDIADNRITELSFLNPLLFGETSLLKSLDVSRNNLINKEEMQSFIEKLRKIRGLKRLAVRGYGELSGSVRTSLIDALRHNTDIEHVDFLRMDLPLDLNRGGRRVFETTQQPFPTNLLPLVLERASKISYYKRRDKWGRPTNEEPRTDVVFWMVQRIVPQL